MSTEAPLPQQPALLSWHLYNCHELKWQLAAWQSHAESIHSCPKTEMYKNMELYWYILGTPAPKQLYGKFLPYLSFLTWYFLIKRKKYWIFKLIGIHYLKQKSLHRLTIYLYVRLSVTPIKQNSWDKVSTHMYSPALPHTFASRSSREKTKPHHNILFKRQSPSILVNICCRA